MAKVRRKRHEYPPAKRAQVLAAASREGLTALEVQRRFGVIPATYYSWRKKAGVTRRHDIGGVLGRDAEISGQVRHEVRARIRKILPGVVRSEVSSYLEQILRSSTQRLRA